MDKVELLAPAGDLEKLKIAVLYGADAVYFGGESFSLRAGADNFSLDEMKEGLEFAHARGVKCYLALNIYAHNEDIEPLREYLHRIRELALDAFIAADPAVIDMIREAIPKAKIHLSTQANMTNYMTAMFWYRQGIRRLVLARELSLAEIAEIRANTPADLALEAFVHGAMCISYSGRCLLSNFMIERDANRGQCAHPCRWKYALVEQQRPGEYYPLEEDERGSYILNSKDLCMIEHIPELIAAGVTSFKIEGRMKSVFYVATVVAAYRQALDSYLADPEGWRFEPAWMEELCKASHREFATGFYFHEPDNNGQNYRTSQYTRDYTFLAMVRSYDRKTRLALVEQRNKMTVGDEIEVFGPGGVCFRQQLDEMYDAESGEAISSAPHPKQLLLLRLRQPCGQYFMLRKRKEEKC